MRKSLAIIALASLTGLFILLAASLHKKPLPVVTSTFLQMPAITLPDEQGKPVNLQALQGKVYLVNLFASWCPVCIAEFPELHRLQQLKLLPIYGIAWKDTKPALQKLLQDNNPYSQVLLDDDGRLVVALGATGAPETYLVDEHGTVVYHYAGLLDETVMNTELLPAIRKALHVP